MIFRFSTRKLLRFFTRFLFFELFFFQPKRRKKKLIFILNSISVVCTESRRNIDWKLIFFFLLHEKTEFFLSHRACFDFQPRYSGSHRSLDCSAIFFPRCATCGWCSFICRWILICKIWKFLRCVSNKTCKCVVLNFSYLWSLRISFLTYLK